MATAGAAIRRIGRMAGFALALGCVGGAPLGAAPARPAETRPAEPRLAETLAGPVAGLPTHGDPVSTYRLAVRHEHGEGVIRDLARALELYCAADRAGHAAAAYAIGWIHANGRGVARDEDLAAAWFRRAAARGHVQAEKLLRVIPGRDPARVAACPGSAPEIAAARSPAFRAAPDGIRSLVRELAPEYRLDPALVLAVIAVESSFRSDAVSPKNAQGLMQLIPATAARFGVRDAFDPEENLRGGMAYLRWLLDHFAGNVQLAVAAYNAGENAVVRHRGVPPYAETRAYVKKIQQLYPRAFHGQIEPVLFGRR